MLHQQTQVLNLASYFLSKTDIFGFVFLFHFINVIIFEFIASWCLSVSSFHVMSVWFSSHMSKDMQF